MLYNRVECTIYSRLEPLKLDTDPIGLNNSETQIGRSETSYGIFTKEVNNLEFTGKAKQYLENLYLIDGVNAVARLVKKEKHPITDEWELRSDGYLDFTTRKIEKNRLKIDFVEGGLREILNSQFREKFEIDRETDIKGNPISTLQTDTLALKGRDIYLLSTLESKNTTAFRLKSGIWQSDGGLRPAHRAAPVTITSNSDPENISPVVESLGHHGQHIEGGAETKFYALANRDRGRIKLKIDLNFRIQDVYWDAVGPDPVEMKVFLRRYTDERESGGSEFTAVTPDVEVLDIGDPRNHIGQSYAPASLELTFEGSSQVRKGDSFGFYFYLNGSYGTELDSGQMQVYIDQYDCFIDWQEDSFYQQTTTNFLRAFDVGKRLTEIFTGKPSFRSTLLNDSWNHLGLTCGFWLRNMVKKTEEGSEERTMTISFEDFYKSINAIEPVGYGVVTEGNNQYIAFESLKYFFQPYTTIKLGQVSNIKRQTATEFVYSSIATGYVKGGNYEKPLGLDEYNIQSNYISPITKVEAKYEALGASRADSYAVEQARRMPHDQYPNQDTPYDKDNFLIDAIQNGATYEVRPWQNDFLKAPTGVYSPDTAFNLRLTPAYNRNRHAYWFNAATVKFPTEKIRYTSSEGNSELSTQLTGGIEVKENADIAISDLSQPIFEPEWVEFEVPYTTEIHNQLTGRTKIGDEFIDNYYGLMEYENEAGKKEKAYLFTAKIKDKITFKALKAYGI